ncbi:MAG: PRC-barrel domain-containing protein [Actinomycetota bacterium]|nr:PRC-barrel domain-containing protein [Actinomycetota bacterium]
MADESYYRASSTFSGWELRDPLGRRVGHVSRIFVGLSGRAVHVKVALGPFGTRTVLLPVDGVRVDPEDRALFLGKARGRAASAEPGRQGL